MNRKTTIDEKVSHGSLDENQAMSWARGAGFLFGFLLAVMHDNKSLWMMKMLHILYEEMIHEHS